MVEMKVDEELKQGKSIPISYKNLLFPLEEKPKEIELVYGCKEK